MQKLVKNHVFSLIAWILILVVSLIALPNITGLTRQHSGVSLPQDVQSEVAQSIQTDWGPKQKNTYQIAVVFNKQKGKLTQADKQAINHTVANLQEHQSEYGIKQVLAPDENIATKKRLQSKDNTTWVMQLNVAKKHAAINEVEEQLTNAVKTTGVSTYVTGADVLQNAFSDSIQEGIKKTELITVIFIFIVLVLVFKSPIVPLVSLLTVGVAFITSFSLVTNLVEHNNFPFSNFTQVFMIIVLFGIGTDYNILLFDKFKENLGKGQTRYQAMKDALKVAGKTILFSGSTILIGFAALGLAKFSIYQSAVGVAVGVAVLLLVLLTLNPFFMAVLGDKLFWPVKEIPKEHENKMWHGIAKSSLAHPIIYLLILAVVVTPFALLYSGHLNYDDTAEISNDNPAKAGMLVVKKHFPAGMAEPSTLYIKSNHRLDNEADLKIIDQLTRQLQASKGVAFATSVTQPYGENIQQLYVNNQLNTVNNGVDDARTGLGKVSKSSQKLATGANQLQTGTNQLQSGTSSLQAGATELQNSSQQLTSGLNQLNSQLTNSSQGSNTQAEVYRKSLSRNLSSVPGLTKQQKAAVMQAASAALNESMAGNANGSLQSSVGSLAAAANQVSSGAANLAGSVGQLNSSTGQLSTGAGQLATGVPKITTGVDEVNSGLGQGAAYLTGLASSSAADTFYIPQEYLKTDMFQNSIKVYLSPNKKSAMLMVVLNSDPSADRAVSRVQDLSLMAQKSLQGTRLDKATVAMGGESAKIADTKRIASDDFVKTAAIMLVGIGIALIFVTKSLLQPVYILGTLLLAYFCSLSITEWLVKAILGNNTLTWNTPFFSFIMLIALGVDYSIFLMTRYRSLDHGKLSERILKACGVIGTVVVSAAIILGGTFAALIPSGVPTLIEVALAVIIGLIILVFILPLILPAAIKLTYEPTFRKKSRKNK
ncbi:MMPL family transporter [Lactobacillus sp. ESL0684]|uniref:MMPL family transporter n=1 Tax=Lactobacillus sp. ESL0684 TaxID=2983213 RepID=UPI0023F6FB8F|nr:MMPL family transporter [Lactobacillus sp. ESL0684]WEV43898.1 MMPL family transporter [Lactobacillus sp. ESL0684]